MHNVGEQLQDLLFENGAAMVGFGELSEFPSHSRQGLPNGVSVVVKYPKEVIRGIHTLPTREYHEHYNLLNERLDALVSMGADFLQDEGYTAIAQTRDYVNQHCANDSLLLTEDILPHKTFATRAGIGWIGKCALLVTKEYGSMVRLSSILTDAPLPVAEPINESFCGDCDDCVRACPAQAVSGRQWCAGLPRDEFFDYAACEITAQQRSLQGFGQPITICGKCIEVCPYTRSYLGKRANDQHGA